MKNPIKTVKTYVKDHKEELIQQANDLAWYSFGVVVGVAALAITARVYSDQAWKDADERYADLNPDDVFIDRNGKYIPSWQIPMPVTED